MNTWSKGGKMIVNGKMKKRKKQDRHLQGGEKTKDRQGGRGGQSSMEKVQTSYLKESQVQSSMEKVSRIREKG